MTDTAKQLIAYLHFGKGNEPRQTVSVPVKEEPLWFHTRGLQQTASGYGRRLATPYKVQWAGKWRRVYSVCMSNVSTEYLGDPNDWLCTVGLEWE